MPPSVIIIMIMTSHFRKQELPTWKHSTAGFGSESRIKTAVEQAVKVKWMSNMVKVYCCFEVMKIV